MASKKHKNKLSGSKSHVPPVTPIDITAYDNDENLVSCKFRSRDGEEVGYDNLQWGSVKAPIVGGRYLCRIESRKKKPVKLSPIKFLNTQDKKILAVANKRGKAWEFTPIDKSSRKVFSADAKLKTPVKQGDLLSVQISGNRVMEITDNFGSADGVGGINKLSLLQFGVVEEFPPEVLAAAEACGDDESIALPDGYEDMTAVPLVTIDGADAKDFDDAVYAEPHGDGWRLLVAIADVGYYVGLDSAMDKEARRRGNSIYLPGMVVPMLPFALSAGLCSLQPDKRRYALAVEMEIDAGGTIGDYRFKRIVMRSHGRLIYDDVDAYLQGGRLEAEAAVLESLQNLHELYKVLAAARDKRGALEITGGDRTAELDADGNLLRVVHLQQTPARKLIEEMMVAANVCAARYLLAEGLAGMHRNHESPPADKVDSFADMVEALGYQFSRSSVAVKNFNAIARQAHERGEADAIEMLILRSQSQAYYAPEKKGHFGLGLQDYCHFTSPIRRYADLLVHRAIKSRLAGERQGLGMGDLTAIGMAISDTEREAMNVERAAMDRISALYLQGLEAEEFSAVVRSVTNFALFVYIAEAGADAILPFAGLPRDYYKIMAGGAALVGADGGLTLRLGDAVRVRVVEVDYHSGKIAVEYIDGGGYTKPTGRGGGRVKPKHKHKGRKKHGGKRKPRFRR